MAQESSYEKTLVANLLGYTIHKNYGHKGIEVLQQGLQQEHLQALVTLIESYYPPG